MKNSRDGKSYSTNLAFTPPEYLRTGSFITTAIEDTISNLATFISLYAKNVMQIQWYNI